MCPEWVPAFSYQQEVDSIWADGYSITLTLNTATALKLADP
jgi:hypothetical protein